ncbi:AAA family ATPase [uncultured Sutterella sp.]|uniref:AAA family ATPase n=1 Tax=uncultured Sutterella sp. TaxID=286133 RepID=UPI00259AFAC8|nr:AAA family ATPase [uncultured Sutterella sp.]
MTKNLRPLPLGISEFSQLRESGAIYVDKTDVICSNARIPGNMIYIARPRGFGKTLLLSTYESLFSRGSADLRGLKGVGIWKLRRVHRIVRLDFDSLCGSPDAESFEARFDSSIVDTFSRQGFKLVDGDRRPPLLQISDWLRGFRTHEFVLLVDNYDSPWLESLEDKARLSRVRAKFFEFCRMIASAEKVFRFACFTAITQIPLRDMFEFLHHLTMMSDAALACGFTEKELRDNFDGWLERAREHGMWFEMGQLLESLWRRYGGYQFNDGYRRQRLYNPFSILSFLAHPEYGFEEHWVRAEPRPQLVASLIRRAFRETAGSVCAGDLRYIDYVDYVAPDPAIRILTEMGYMSLRKKDCLKITVDFPNTEVRVSMSRELSRELLNGINPADHGIPPTPDERESSFVDDDVLIQKFLELLRVSGRSPRNFKQAAGMLTTLLLTYGFNEDRDVIEYQQSYCPRLRIQRFTQIQEFELSFIDRNGRSSPDWSEGCTLAAVPGAFLMIDYIGCPTRMNSLPAPAV